MRAELLSLEKLGDGERKLLTSLYESGTEYFRQELEAAMAANEREEAVTSACDVETWGKEE